MKKLILLSLMLVGCTHEPKFKTGDCTTIPRHLEKWEKQVFSIDRIVEVGQEKYLMLPVGMAETLTWSFSISLYDSVAVKVECPKE